jgi:hypothetical protein
MNKKKLLMALIFVPLIIIWSVVGHYAEAPVGPLATTTFSVTPDTIINEAKQPPATFSVNLTIADVTNLNTWQANVTWDPAMLDYTSYKKGTFLAGNPTDSWHGRPYADVTTPFSLARKNATGTAPFPVGNWSNPLNAANSNNVYATCSTNGKNQYYYTFGISGLSTVSKLEVAVEASTTETNVTKQDKIDFWLSKDNGVTYGPLHTADVFVSEILTYYDVTGDYAWVPNDLINGALKIKIQYRQVGDVATEIKLDWLGVRVTDTLTVTNPTRAWDNNVDSYANFTYSQRNAFFNVTEYSHFLPYGGDDPTAEQSDIVQVDFSMKYSATASGGGTPDRYRIVYNAPVITGTSRVLQDWKSTATALDTYTWTNQIDPNDASWDWSEIAAITFGVQTNRVGGDATAKFNEYEAWITVTYKRPTTIATSVDQTKGYLIIGESTSQGQYPGVDGSGWLAQLTFTVQDYGYTALNITNPLTKLLDTARVEISCTKTNGYFRNGLTGDANLDKTIDVFDILAVKSRWGRTPASPDWIREYDVNDDKAIDVFDILTVKANWGRTIP